MLSQNRVRLYLHMRIELSSYVAATAFCGLTHINTELFPVLAVCTKLQPIVGFYMCEPLHFAGKHEPPVLMVNYGKGFVVGGVFLFSCI